MDPIANRSTSNHSYACLTGSRRADRALTELFTVQNFDGLFVRLTGLRPHASALRDQ